MRKYLKSIKQDAGNSIVKMETEVHFKDKGKPCEAVRAGTNKKIRC